MEILSLAPSPTSPEKKVTALKPALRTENRINVFVDDKFSFSLDLVQVVDFGLKIGKTLTDAEIEELKHASNFGKLYISTLEWVLSRPHSVKETRDHLKLKLLKRRQLNKTRQNNQKYLAEHPELRRRRKELKIYTSELELFTSEDIENVIKKLIEKKYLNDENFAKFYVENRRVKKGVSERRLREELIKKGVSAEIINEVLDSTERNPEDEIKKVIFKKRNKYDSPTKLLSYLLRQGFPYDLSKNLTDDFFANPETFFSQT